MLTTAGKAKKGLKGTKKIKYVKRRVNCIVKMSSGLRTKKNFISSQWLVEAILLVTTFKN